MEFPMMGMHELDVFETFVFRHKSIADDLYFGLVRYSFKIRVQDAAFCVEGFAVAVALGEWVKKAR